MMESAAGRGGLTAYPAAVSKLGGWAIVTGSVAALGVAALALRRNLSGTGIAVAGAVAGAGVALGGLVVVGDVGVASWVVAPTVLATATAAQVKALFAPGGPFRT
jgi:hypothetical protein